MIKINHDDVPVRGQENFAAYLVGQVKIHNEAVQTEFNGSPMTAHVGDDARIVLLRWHYERLLIQIANGVSDAKQYAEKDYIR